MSQLTPEQEKEIEWTVQNLRLSGYEPSQECIENLKQIALGQKTAEEVIKETIEKAKRGHMDE